MKDNSDPLNSYTLDEILKTSSGPASKDIYGKLHYFLKETFASLHHRFRLLDTTFQLFCLDVLDLPSHLGETLFSRIEVSNCSSCQTVKTRTPAITALEANFDKVSNITDGGYVGTAKVLAIFTNWLQPPAENPHATLIALYMNAVAEIANEEADLANPAVTTRLVQYMKSRMKPNMSRYDADAILFAGSLSMVRDRDAIFKRQVTVPTVVRKWRS